jgi:prepilin-type N-terminal cleavage/methylation domain-containing protein
MKRGFTLTEMLVVMAIIAIVAAISFPAFARAQEAAQVSKTFSNMKNLALALNLYRQDYDPAPSGSLEAMGLPDGLKPLGRNYDQLRSPRAPGWYGYHPIPEAEDRRRPSWREFTVERGDSAVMLYDPWFNPPGIPPYKHWWLDEEAMKRVFGMTVGGSAVRRYKTGAVTLTFWYP